MKKRSVDKRRKDILSGKTPMYLKHNGAIYERIDGDTVSVDFDLDEDLIKQLETYRASAGYVSLGELIRHICRDALRSAE